MYIILIVLTLIAAILLIGVVLIQKSKGGGLSSSFAGSNQIMGVRRTNSFIEKVTWTLAGIICVLAILSTFFMPNSIANSGPHVVAPAATEQQAPGYDSPIPAATEAPAPVETPAPTEAQEAADEQAAIDATAVSEN